MATDPLSTTVSGVKLIDALTGLARRFGILKDRGSSEHNPLGRTAERSLPLDFEILLQSFEIPLGQSLPQLSLSLIAINYMSRPVWLESVQASQFQLTGCSVLEGPSTAYNIEIPARRSRYLVCRRTL